MSPGLAPFVPELERDLTDGLRALLATDAPLRLATLPDGWVATADLPLGGDVITVDIFPRGCARDAWFRGPRLAVAYHAGARDPFADPAVARALSDLRARVEGHDAPLRPSPELRAALAAADRWLPYRGLADKDFRLLFDVGGVPTAALWLGFRCDQDCVFCWQRRDVPDPPAEVFGAWLDAMLDAGARVVILSGGEPAARDDLPALVSRVTARGATAVLETSGPRLLDPALRGALRGAGLRDLSIALHATEPAIADAITRAPGAHARALDAAALCLREGFVVRAQCVVDALNVAHLPTLARDLAARLGPLGLREVAFVAPTRGADEGRFVREMVDYDLLRPALAAALDALREAEIPARAFGTAGFPLCVLPAAQRALAPPRGEVASDRRFPRRCQGCGAAARCEGAPAGYVDRFGDKGLSPLPVGGSRGPSGSAPGRRGPAG